MVKSKTFLKQQINIEQIPKKPLANFRTQPATETMPFTYIEKIEYISAPVENGAKAAINTKKFLAVKDSNLQINCEINGNDICQWVKTCSSYIGRKLIFSFNHAFKKKNEPTRIVLPKRSEKFFTTKTKKTLKAFLKYLKRKGIFPKNIEELIAWLLKVRNFAKLLLTQYTREIQYLMLYIAIFDQMRFRSLINIMDAYYAKKWKLFFYLLKKFLKVPLAMLCISLITQNTYAGGLALTYALPFLFFAKFRVPFLTDLLEQLFFEIFPPEVCPIGRSPALIARRILENLASTKQK